MYADRTCWSPFQTEAIDALASGKHVLVCAPTGSGKTLPAIVAIQHFVAHKKKIVYTSPIKALSNQKYADFSKLFPQFAIGLCTGDIKVNPLADIVVATAELLHHRLQEQLQPKEEAKEAKEGEEGKDEEKEEEKQVFQMDLHRECACVVMDECHYLNDPERGHVWEQSIALILTQYPHIQLLLLSATLDAPERLVAWMRSLTNGEVVLARSDHRVVPLRHLAYIPLTSAHVDKDAYRGLPVNRFVVLRDVDLRFSYTNDASLRRTTALLESKELVCTRKQTLNQLSTLLLGQQDMDVDDTLLPAIVFVLSRRGVEACAKDINVAVRRFDDKRGATIAAECAQRLRRQLPNADDYFRLEEYRQLIHLLEKGVAIHHSGMLPVLRELVEVLVQEKQVPLLFATESFAIGLDCPIRSVVFASLWKYDRWLRPHEYIQMAGRAGRRGIDTLGTAIVLPLDTHGLPSSNELQHMLRGGASPLVSAFACTPSTVLHWFRPGPQTLTSLLQQIDHTLAQRQLDLEARATCSALGARPAIQNQVPEQALTAYRELVKEQQKTKQPRKRHDCARRLLLLTEMYPLLLCLDQEEEWDRHQVQLTSHRDALRRQCREVVLALAAEGFLLEEEKEKEEKEEKENRWSLTKVGEYAAAFSEIDGRALASCLAALPQGACSFARFVGLLAAFIRTPAKTRCQGKERGEEGEGDQEEDDLAWIRSTVPDDEDQAMACARRMLGWLRVRDATSSLCFVERLPIRVGEFCKEVLQVCALAKEVQTMAKQDRPWMYQYAADIDAQLLKFVVSAQSLYV